MTIAQIIADCAPHKCFSRETLYRHFRRLKIKPIGARQIPQQYPPDTAKRVLAHLGFASPASPAPAKPITKRNRRHAHAA